MRSGILPDKMKLARGTCIFTGGDPKCGNNYRPISVLPVISKLEKIVCARFTEYLTANSLLADCQFGFRTHRTTENAVQNIVTQLYGDFDAGRYGLGVFLDLAKAFDSLDRTILYDKLKSYGIREVELDWFVNYFLSPPRHLLGSHTVLGTSVPGGVNFASFMAFSFPINSLIPITYPLT